MTPAMTACNVLLLAVGCMAADTSINFNFSGMLRGLNHQGSVDDHDDPVEVSLNQCSKPMAVGHIDASLGTWYPSRYGAEDVIGAANLLTEKKAMEGRALARTGKTYSLAINTDWNLPVFGTRYYNVSGELVTVGGTTNMSYTEDAIDQSAGIGTHVDGLGHISIGDYFYNGIHKDRLELSPDRGIKVLDTVNIPAFVTRAVILDMCALYGVDRLGDSQEITADDLVRAANRQDVCFGEGDVLLLHTGWASVYEKDGDPQRFLASEPGVGMEAAEFIAQQGIVALGADTWALEVIPTPGVGGEIFPGHQILQTKHGVYMIENVKTDELVADGVSEGFFVMAPAKLAGTAQIGVQPLLLI